MRSRRPGRSHRSRLLHSGWVVAACLLLSALVTAQDLTGTLRGTVRDSQGGVLPGAVVRLSSPALIGGTITVTTNAQGQLRFPRLPPGSYVMDVELKGFAPFQEEGIRIGAGEVIERSPILRPAGIAESIVVEGAGSHIEARNSGFATRFGLEDLRAIPTRRSSMFDLVRSAPGVSPTSPSSGITTTISAMGSGTNENLFLFDGTNFTCPCNGVARTRTGCRFHPGSAGAFGRRVRGIRQHAGGGHQCGDQAGRRSFPERRFVLRTAVGVNESACPAPHRGCSGASERLRAQDVPGFHRQCRRAARSQPRVVLYRVSIPARLRQSARHRSAVPENVRAGQGVCEGHVEADAEPAVTEQPASTKHG